MLYIIISTLIIICIYAWSKQHRRLDLPSPPAIPFLGNVIDIEDKCPYEQMAIWARKYGGAICIRVLNENWVVVSSQEHLHTMLVKSGPKFANRPKTFRIFYGTFGGKDLIWQDNHEYFYNVSKKAAHRSLKQYSAGLDTIEMNLKGMLEQFNDKLTQTSGEPTNPTIDIYNFTLQSLLYFTIGKCLDNDSKLFKLGRELERLAVSSATMTLEGALIDLFPWLRYLPTETMRKIHRGMELMTEFWSSVKPGLVETLGDESQVSLMHSLMHTQREETESTGERTIDDDNMKTLLADILVAGTTTTSNSLTAFVNIMVHYPKVQEKLHHEIEHVVGGARPITLRDRENMPYTRAAILELNRYVSVVPFGVPHTAAEDCYLAGALIPKGTNMIANSWALHHDHRFWDEPWKFKPERFLDDQGELVPADHENRKNLLPFGAGSRVCIGEVFAMARMFLFIASVFQHFHVEAGPGELVSCDPRTYLLGIALSPPEFNVCFKAKG